jgi:hypothetical protein
MRNRLTAEAAIHPAMPYEQVSLVRSHVEANLVTTSK